MNEIDIRTAGIINRQSGEQIGSPVELVCTDGMHADQRQPKIIDLILDSEEAIAGAGDLFDVEVVWLDDMSPASTTCAGCGMHVEINSAMAGGPGVDTIVCPDCYV
jgi:hypothetical protein